MAQLDSQRDEIFCQQWPSGKLSPRHTVFAAAKENIQTAAELRAKPGIQERVDELTGASADRGDLTRAQLLDFYVKIIFAKPSDAGPDNPLREVRMSKAGPYFALPDKLGAGAALAKMNRWNAPEKVEQSASDAMVGMTARLTGAKKE